VDGNATQSDADAMPAADQADAYRGFLFADLRGYTAFVERHGDAAAADLLDAYRGLVREVVAQHAGAEIRTEGDSFYVVFGSARRAVACGLAIVTAAARAAEDHPERPIRVGIGINAGETVQRAEGFVGTAVNLAARVCAQARAGEVLVTAAVRETLGASPDLQLLPRGTHRLKGIARPVSLFAARPTNVAPVRRTRFAGVPWFVGAVAIVVLLAALIQWRGASGSPSGSVEPTGEASPSILGSASTAIGPSPTAAAGLDEFPNAAEAELLAAVGSRIEPYCDRAHEDDRPRLIVDQVARDLGFTPEMLVASHVGIECEVPGSLPPDSFQLWATRAVLDYGQTDVGEALIVSKAGRLGIPRGDCAEGSQAHGPWQLGDIGGWFLCRDDFGDAVIEWSYDGSVLYGIARRRDGDLGTLLEWWRDEARFIGS
jgi:class 3 adenylate cyclase